MGSKAGRVSDEGGAGSWETKREVDKLLSVWLCVFVCEAMNARVLGCARALALARVCVLVLGGLAIQTILEQQLQSQTDTSLS